MFKIIKTLILIIWIIDICNINFTIDGMEIAFFLDEVVPLNTLFWFLLWLVIPGSSRYED
jgi:hypothetical protein